MGAAAEDGPSNATLKPLVHQLLSVLSVALPKGEYPYVRYISEKLNIGKTFVSKQLADLLDREMIKQMKAAGLIPSSSSASASSSAAASAPHSTAAGMSTSAAPASSSSSSASSSLQRNTTILIVDRSLDPLTPLMHEFTFQAMVNDLLKVTGSEIVHLAPKKDPSQSQSVDASPSGTLTSQSKADLQKQLAQLRSGKTAAPAASSSTPSSKTDEESEIVLSEDDALWIEYRHKHIGEVMVAVNRALKEFASSNKMAQYQQMQSSLAAKKGGAAAKESVKDVLRAVQEMPEYKAAMRRFTKHVSLSEECLDKFKARSLQVIGELEQCLATNTDIEGHVYKDNREVKERLKKLVTDKATERPISVLDKLRLITIYAIVHGQNFTSRCIGKEPK